MSGKRRSVRPSSCELVGHALGGLANGLCLGVALLLSVSCIEVFLIFNVKSSFSLDSLTNDSSNCLDASFRYPLLLSITVTTLKQNSSSLS